jgi:hypothetical protein
VGPHTFKTRKFNLRVLNVCGPTVQQLLVVREESKVRDMFFLARKNGEEREANFSSDGEKRFDEDSLCSFMTNSLLAINKSS